MRTAKVPRLTKKTTAYKLLDEVCKVILEEPKRYFQGWWLDKRTSECQAPMMAPADEFPACGTIGCVAGWVSVLVQGARIANDGYAEMDAAQILGLENEPDLTLKLFNEKAVPERLKYGTNAYAKAGVAHIRKFQKRNADRLKATVVKPGRVS